MLIALHIDVSDWSKLLGVWVAPAGSSGFPDCFYPDPVNGCEIGRGRMEVKGETVPWPAFFWRLQNSSPYSAYWSVREVDDDVSLPELFESLAVDVANSADDLADGVAGDGFAIAVPGVKMSSSNASKLAAAIGGPTDRFKPTQRLSTLCHFFADEHRMVVVARSDVDQTAADLALAWGLAYRGDRQLSVVLPANRATPTRVRAPWLVPPIRVFVYDGDEVSEPLPMTEHDSIESFRSRTIGQPKVAALGDKSGWVQSVLDWADIAPGVEVIERKSYVSWHVAGRQVLKMIPTAKRLTVIAGVDSTKPENWDPAVKVILQGHAEDHVQHAIVAAAARAASARLAGIDSGHHEHKMQAALHPEQLGLESNWLREFPAWRPGSTHSAFIDFLAKDQRGRVHVVETKIGDDTMLVLQGLDYWLWCRAHVDETNRILGATSKRLPVISYVVASTEPGGAAISMYTAAQVEALHRDIEWRFVVVDTPDTAEGVHPLEPYRLPQPHRRADGGPARWGVRLHRHLVQHAIDADVTLKRSRSFVNAEQGLVPAAIPSYQQLVVDGAAHTHIASVQSSQAFALNLLAPLTTQEWTAIAQHHLQDPTARVTEPVVFEYTDPIGALGEATHASPHATQVDCLVKIQLDRGRTHVLLIEVKLSEDAFSTCSAYSSAANTRRAICAQPGPFGGNTQGCFQLANHDREHRRTYDEMLGQPSDEPVTFGCWFRDGANQAMRNAALGKALVARGDVQSASMMLMAPDDHTAIWEQWHRHVSLLSLYKGITFADLRASRVVALHTPEQAKALSARYLLPLDLLALRHAQQLVDARFPDGVALTRLNPDGSVSYRDGIARLRVFHADADHITFLQPYPAGPIEHRTPRSVWEHTTGDITIPDPQGDPPSSRIISADHSNLDEQTQGELPGNAHLDQQRSPWWTAPIN